MFPDQRLFGDGFGFIMVFQRFWRVGGGMGVGVSIRPSLGVPLAWEQRRKCDMCICLRQRLSLTCRVDGAHWIEKHLRFNRRTLITKALTWKRRQGVLQNWTLLPVCWFPFYCDFHLLSRQWFEMSFIQIADNSIFLLMGQLVLVITASKMQRIIQNTVINSCTYDWKFFTGSQEFALDWESSDPLKLLTPATVTCVPTLLTFTSPITDCICCCWRWSCQDDCDCVHRFGCEVCACALWFCCGCGRCLWSGPFISSHSNCHTWLGDSMCPWVAHLPHALHQALSCP